MGRERVAGPTELLQNLIGSWPRRLGSYSGVCRISHICYLLTLVVRGCPHPTPGVRRSLDLRPPSVPPVAAHLLPQVTAGTVGFRKGDRETQRARASSGEGRVAAGGGEGRVGGGEQEGRSAEPGAGRKETIIFGLPPSLLLSRRAGTLPDTNASDWASAMEAPQGSALQSSPGPGWQSTHCRYSRIIHQPGHWLQSEANPGNQRETESAQVPLGTQDPS